MLSGSIEAPCVNVQVPIHPNGRFHLIVHFKPPPRPKAASVWSPQSLISGVERHQDAVEVVINGADVQVVSDR